MNPVDIMQWLPVGLLLVFSGVLTVTSVILVVKNYQQVLAGAGKAFMAVGQAIAAICKAIHANYKSFVDFARSKLLTRGAFFRYAILVCMMMSVVHGSHLFTTQNNISALDLALAATFDIGTWVLMEAMISTRKRGYLGASIGILVSIVIVSSISFLANLAFNAHYYDPSQFSGFDLSGYGLDTKAVLIGAQSSPPLIIILMTLVAETFIKADIKEEVTYAQRIWARHQRKIDREEAKLRLASERIKLQQQYKTLKPGKREIRVPAWSFLGLTVYQKQQLSAMPEMTEIVNLQKIVEELRVDIHRQQEETVLPGASLQTPAQNLSTPMSTKNGVVVDDVVDEKRQPVDDLFVDSLLDGEDDDLVDNEDDIYVSAGGDSAVDTGERETVNWQVTSQVTTPRPRVTIKLPEVHSTRAKKERITDNLAPTTKKTRKVNAIDAKERIRRLLKKQPDMEPAEIAAKIGVTRQYAHKIKAQISAEKTA